MTARGPKFAEGAHVAECWTDLEGRPKGRCGKVICKQQITVNGAPIYLVRFDEPDAFGAFGGICYEDELTHAGDDPADLEVESWSA